MGKKILIPVADGTEEIEAVCLIDVLRRAGADVTVASVGKSLQITASRGVRMVADQHISDCQKTVYDLIVLPGGMPGAEHLRDNPELISLLRAQKASGRLYGAMCASPAVVLQTHGLLENMQATCHPAFNEKLVNLKPDRVVVDGTCVTSQAPGTALEFALKLVELLFGRQKAEIVATPMLVLSF
ncbi:MAG: DJ-1/PfpI family protein [SAR324 cluster bacterium]|nr:DJ-1/PfpI family protein [SAR324 cluster bacterium]